MTRLLALILLLTGFLGCLPNISLADDSEKLLKVVALSRHGVRAPTQSHKTLEQWSQRPWPVWPVKKGDLTPRGAALISAMWQELRGSFIEKGLLPDSTCPSPGMIHVRADTDERTRATAAALLEGLGRDCGLGYAVAENEPDPLFHPVKAGEYHFDPIQAVINVLSMADGDLGELQDDYMGSLNLLTSIAGSPAPALCLRFADSPNCNLSDLPNAVSVSPDGSDVKLVGALSIASSMAEIFLLEYAEWPNVPAGWGLVNASTLSQLLPVHARIFDVINRAPIVARVRGSALLHEMGDALAGNHVDPAVNDARLVVFVGHDTNIANLGALLGAFWDAPGYPANGIPPGSLLTMELWSKNGRQEVRLRFYAQSLQTLHSELPKENLSTTVLGSFGPVCSPVTVPPVVGEARFSLEEFMERVGHAITGAPAVNLEKTRLEYGMPAE